jgi:hypothetical protein
MGEVRMAEPSDDPRRLTADFHPSRIPRGLQCDLPAAEVVIGENGMAYYRARDDDQADTPHVVESPRG